MRIPFLVLLLCVAPLAGCADKPPAEDGEELEVTQTTGGIRGVVVDDAIRPLPGATVRLHTGQETTSGEDGTFRFIGLEPGEYFLTAQKLGYAGTQATSTVRAGVADPPAVRMTLIFLPGQQPFVETYKMQGFYDCAMATAVVTDSCDWVYRTGHDVLNESGNPPPTPRSIQRFHNTEFIDIAPGVTSIIQEAVWNDPQVSVMKISLDATPIDAACDCSNSFLEVDQPSPTYGRLDGEQVPGGETVAARGFLPFGEPQIATSFEFQVFTTLFHNLDAPEGWSFVAGDAPPA